MSEEKAYATVSTIFSRVSRDFPLISSIQSISKRLSNDLRDRISDVQSNIFRDVKMDAPKRKELD
jgi:hypothetical protein